jgi:tetratricopeptide (TPR) repeat protein
MDIHAVDLASSKLFQEWYLQETKTNLTPALDIVEALGLLNSTTAKIRALCVSYWANLPTYEDMSKLCLYSGDTVAAETAKGFAVYRRTLEVIREAGPNLKAKISEMSGALEWSHKALDSVPVTDMVIEARIGVMIPMCVLLTFSHRHEEAIQLASQGLFLAEQLKAPITIARLRARLIDYNSNAGRTVNTVALVEEDRKQAYRYTAHHSETELADALYDLGNIERATDILNTLINTNSGEIKSRVIDFKIRQEAIWGIGGLEEPLNPPALGSMPYNWMINTSRELMRAYGTPREGSASALRAGHFSNAIALCRTTEEVKDTFGQLFSQWATATAHMGRGEFVDAVGIVEHMDVANPEWLSIRVLWLGAALELSLSWQAPEGCSTARYEQKLRDVFADATRLRFASPSGLARLLHRWHPVAAAYMALVPNPIQACAFATRSVMKVGQYNFACDDVSIPPVMACDLMIRALDLDLRRDFTFVQSDAGGQRFKKKLLFQKAGTVEVWRLPVSAVKLAYGMMRHQGVDYHERASSIIETYGIRPITAALYPMVGALDEIERCTKELLAGYITTKGFAVKMNNIGR